jgi:hypothetical protein
MNNATIKGTDAVVFAEILVRLTKAFEKEQAKDGNV